MQTVWTTSGSWNVPSNNISDSAPFNFTVLQASPLISLVLKLFSQNQATKWDVRTTTKEGRKNYKSINPEIVSKVPTFVKFEAAEKRVSEVKFSSRCCSSRNDQGKENDTELGQKSCGKIPVRSWVEKLGQSYAEMERKKPFQNMLGVHCPGNLSGSQNLPIWKGVGSSVFFSCLIYFRQVSTWKMWFRPIQRRIFHWKNGPNSSHFKFKKFQIARVLW